MQLTGAVRRGCAVYGLFAEQSVTNLVNNLFYTFKDENLIIWSPITSVTIKALMEAVWVRFMLSAHLFCHANPAKADKVISVWSLQARRSHSVPCRFQPCQFVRVHAPAAYGGNMLSWELVSWLGLPQPWDRWWLTGPLRETVLLKDNQPTLSSYLGSAHLPGGLSPPLPLLTCQNSFGLTFVWVSVHSEMWRSIKWQ